MITIKHGDLSDLTMNNGDMMGIYWGYNGDVRTDDDLSVSKRFYVQPHLG